MNLTALTAASGARLRAARLTYPEVGGTRRALPSGYRNLYRDQVIGSGSHTFTGAAAALLNWQVHLRAGIGVSASSPIAAEGADVLLHWRIGPLRLTAPCRVVYVINEPGLRGFAYGTLDGHPESGEEAFCIRLHEDGTVTLAITAFSRPATRLAIAAGPFGRYLQDMITGRYLQSLQPAPRHSC